MGKKKKEGTLLSGFKGPDFHSNSTDRLIADQLLEKLNAKKKISELKKLFKSATKHHNDKVAVELLNLLDEALYMEEKEIAERPDGDRHLGNAHNRATRQLRDWLMEIYWELPDMKIVASGQHPYDDEHRPTMLQTKYWILEQIIQDWSKPEGRFGTRAGRKTSSKISKDAFDFLITAFASPSADSFSKEESKFGTMAKERLVSGKEKEKIIKLIEKHDTFFSVSEIEEWLEQFTLPLEIEKRLALARIRKNPDQWRKDVKKAKLVKRLRLDQFSEYALDHCYNYCQQLLIHEKAIQKLIKMMQEGKFSSTTCQIGKSEAVVAEKIEHLFNDLSFRGLTIKILLKDNCSKELGMDIAGRARRHIKNWIPENWPWRKYQLTARDQRYVLLIVQGGAEKLKQEEQIFVPA